MFTVQSYSLSIERALKQSTIVCLFSLLQNNRTNGSSTIDMATGKGFGLALQMYIYVGQQRSSFSRARVLTFNALSAADDLIRQAR
jgi:hypothetical protein